MKWLGIMLMTALLVGAPGYGSAEPPGKDSTSPATQSKNLEKQGEQAGAVKSYTPEEKRAYQKKTAADLEKLQERIGDLRAKGQQAPPQTKRTYTRATINLDRMAIAAQNKVTALEKASGQDWSRLNAETDQAMAALSKACLEAEKRLE